jgi:hypothetical protein
VSVETHRLKAFMHSNALKWILYLLFWHSTCYLVNFSAAQTFQYTRHDIAVTATAPTIPIMSDLNNFTITSGVLPLHLSHNWCWKGSLLYMYNERTIIHIIYVYDTLPTVGLLFILLKSMQLYM